MFMFAIDNGGLMQCIGVNNSRLSLARKSALSFSGILLCPLIQTIFTSIPIWSSSIKCFCMSFTILNELLLFLIACNDESESVKMFAEGKKFSLIYSMANFIAQSSTWKTICCNINNNNDYNDYNVGDNSINSIVTFVYLNKWQYIVLFRLIINGINIVDIGEY